MEWRTENEGASRRVLVTKDLPGERWREILAAADCELRVGGGDAPLDVEAIREGIGERCDGAIGQLTEPWGAELFEALARAGGRAYSNYAVGYDNVRVEEATRRGIAVGNTPGVLTETTAELAVALTLAAARRIPEAEGYLREGRFCGWLPDLFLGKRLHGATAGVAGCGRIGAAYARALAFGFSMDILYWDRSPREDLERELAAFAKLDRPGAARRAPSCRRVEDLGELLERSDVVSLHLPLTDATRHLIDRAALERMRPDAVLVNTSRGPVVDETALVDHLRRHPSFRAGLDVFENEPRLAPGLAGLPNAVLVPHIGSATDWTREGMAALAAANVAAVLRGDPVASEIDPGPFLRGEVPRRAPSIVNAEDLGLARG